MVESLARDRDRKLMLDRLRNDLMSEPTPSRPLPAPVTPADPAGLATVPARQRLEIARATLARLELQLTESHPDLRRAREQVAEIEKEVQAEPPAQQGASTAAGMTPEVLQRRERINSMGAEIESLDRQIAFKEAEERRLRGSIADYQRRIEAVPGVESEWLSLTRDYETISDGVQGAAHEERVGRTRRLNSRVVRSVSSSACWTRRAFRCGQSVQHGPLSAWEASALASGSVSCSCCSWNCATEASARSPTSSRCCSCRSSRSCRRCSRRKTSANPQAAARY